MLRNAGLNAPLLFTCAQVDLIAIQKDGEDQSTLSSAVVLCRASKALTPIIGAANFTLVGFPASSQDLVASGARPHTSKREIYPSL